MLTLGQLLLLLWWRFLGGGTLTLRRHLKTAGSRHLKTAGSPRPRRHPGITGITVAAVPPKRLSTSSTAKMLIATKLLIHDS